MLATLSKADIAQQNLLWEDKEIKFDVPQL